MNSIVENVHQEKDMKVRVLKEQVTHCTTLLQRTTGLLHFCIEVLKEGDPASYVLLMSKSYKNRNGFGLPKNY
jgi:tripartite motif-containing protein 9/67